MSNPIAIRQVRHHDWRGLMSTLEAETEIKNTVQATEAVEIIDCGRASERTNGIPLLLLFELGTPPNNKLYLF
jgi:hypothetical protein